MNVYRQAILLGWLLIWSQLSIADPPAYQQYIDQSKYNEAISIIHFHLNSKTQNADDEFELYLKLSNCFSYLSAFDSAAHYLNRAQQIIPSLSQNELKIDWLIEKAFLMGQQEKSDSSIYYHRRIVESCVKPHQRDKLLAAKRQIALESIESGNFKKGLSLLKQNLEEQLQYYKNENHLEVGLTYNALGYAYFKTTNFAHALHYFDKTLAVYEKVLNPNHYHMGFVLNNLALIYNRKGDYQKAIQYYLKAYFVCSTIFQGNNLIQSLIYVNLSDAYRNLNELDQALYYLNSALKELESKLGRNHQRVAHAYLKKGEIMLAQNQFDDAITNTKVAIEVYATLSGWQYYKIGICYVQLAECYKHKSNFKKAYELFDRANALLKNIGEQNELKAEFNLKFGELYFLDGSFDLALEKIEQGILSLRAATVDLNKPINKLHNNVTLMRLYYLRAKAYFAQHQMKDSIGHLVKVYQACMSAIDVFNAMQQSFTNEGSKLNLLSEIHPVINLGMEATYFLYEQTEDQKYKQFAFYLMEKSKCSILISSMLEQEAKIKYIPDSVYYLEQDLRASVAYYSTKLRQETKQIAQVSNQLFKYQKKYETFIKKIEEKYPKYYQLKYQNVQVSIAQVQGRLLEDEVMVSYYIGKTNSYLLLISKDKTTFTQLQIGERQLDNLVIRFRFHLSNHLTQTNTDKAIYNKISYELFSKILEPIYPLINDKELIIIPDGSLHQLPFEVLFTSKYEQGNLRGAPFLLLNSAISYLYSSNFLTEERNQTQQLKTNSVLAFAPSFDAKDNMAPLDWTKNEVNAIKEYFEVNQYLDKQATEVNFKQVAGNHDIIHIASHALISGKDPNQSKIIFSSGHSNEDDELHIYELYNLNLKSKLAVLSACNTGHGKFIKGEGVMSLARGFTYAGCPSIVMSLWSASDKSTAKIMKKFYAGLSSGMTKRKALQEAKIEYFKNASGIRVHPYFWSQFVLVGDTSPIQVNFTQMSIRQIIPPIIIVLIATILIGWHKLRRF